MFPRIFVNSVIARLACGAVVATSTFAGTGLGSEPKAGVPSRATAITFEAHIRPIFKTHCFQCHGEAGAKEGQLDLRLARLAVAGGDSGPAVNPGKPKSSYLLDRVKSGEMPAGKKPLSADEASLLERWIVQGAKTARPEPADPNAVVYTEEERGYWAFQPIKSQPVPTAAKGFEIRTPIDAFLAAKLADNGIRGFRPLADRRTLIRRATFDLIGLPPTPEEVDAFVVDKRSDAWERLLDRLLASPQYGERWGRHWLDVAGYAESDLRFTKDQPRDWAWKYRDYVIRSFNADKPWNEFIVEQLAADELTPQPLVNLAPEVADRLAAVSFLRMGPDNTQAENTTLERNRVVAEMLKITSSAFLGMTVGCAECHDHRYDPMSTIDYYRLRAVFDPAFDIHHWKLPGERVVRVTPKEKLAKIEKIEAEAAALEKLVAAEEQQVAAGIQEREIAKAPASKRDALRQALKSTKKDQTAAEKALFAEFLTVRPIPQVIGLLVEYDRKAFEKLKARKQEVAKLRATKPPDEFVGIPAESPNPACVSRVFFRGDFDQPKQAVTPAEPALFAMNRPSPDLPAKVAKLPTSGRRLELAKRLTDGKHPLCARVLANRFWMHHFGRGIVATPGDFGRLGERPTHPELLDWLANDFMTHGWRLKRFHKLVMMSQAYQQDSKRTPDLERIDGDNRLLGRMSVRRLEAEAVRDALLAVSGDLFPRQFGPSIPVVEGGDGKAIIGKAKLAKDGLFYGEVEDAGPESNRRSIYVQALRVTPYDMFDTFDAPAMSPNCDARKSTTVATQSLLFLNDRIVLDRAERLAQRLEKDCGLQIADCGLRMQVERAYGLLFGRTPTADERSRCLHFLKDQTEFFRTQGGDKWKKEIAKTPTLAECRALASLCQMLFCTNEFLYVD